ncbi:MAG: hypothetical protein WCT99_07965 [Bacteroidota bacterium]|jgi:hypothetical protein
MSYQLEISECDGFLHARVSGKNSALNKLRYLKELRSISVQKKSRRILIEEHLEGTSIDLFDVFDVVVSQSKFASASYDKIAFVDTCREHNADRLKFAERLAGSHGVNVHVFTTAAEAKQWLTSSEK